MFNFFPPQIRLVIEESLNQLPFSKCIVTTPTGAEYRGLKYQKGNCGVSIVRSGEAMEQVMRKSVLSFSLQMLEDLAIMLIIRRASETAVVA